MYWLLLATHIIMLLLLLPLWTLTAALGGRQGQYLQAHFMDVEVDARAGKGPIQVFGAVFFPLKHLTRSGFSGVVLTLASVLLDTNRWTS